VAIILAVVGTYALMAYSVRQRRHEIGIRMALGARAVEIVRHFLREGLTVAAIALGLGRAASALLASTLQSLIWRVDPLDPATFAAAAVLVIGTSAAACLIPALRGARLEPSRALRLE
jgi:putative ABC transport system permease protein